jgi:hypothetical protein
MSSNGNTVNPQENPIYPSYTDAFRGLDMLFGEIGTTALQAVTDEKLKRMFDAKMAMRIAYSVTLMQTAAEFASISGVGYNKFMQIAHECFSRALHPDFGISPPKEFGSVPNPIDVEADAKTNGTHKPYMNGHDKE